MEDYYGSINEYLMQVSNTIKPKPVALQVYEQCTKMKMPLVAGGLQDQPHIWLLMWEIIEEVQGIFLPQLQASQPNTSGSNHDGPY